MLKVIKLLLITFIALVSVLKSDLLAPTQTLEKEKRFSPNIKKFYKVSEKNLFPKTQSVQLQTTIINKLPKKDIPVPRNTLSLSLNIEKIAKSKLGKKYKWGGDGPLAYDCSGFTKEVFKKNGISLPRVSIKQAEVGKKIKRIKKLEKGDLVFFTSRNHHKVDHVGIYLGKGKFIHASHFLHRIVISPLREYKRYFKWGRRLN